MDYNNYRIVLTNGKVEHSYFKYASNEEQAIILAQADAIQNGMGYKLVSIEEV